MKLLYVVHRYAPYSGGSEYNVQIMAEECIKRGYEITVFTSTHCGNLNGVVVTSDKNVIYEEFDLIIVHGCDCVNQNIVLDESDKIKSPILYLLILPSESPIAIKGMKNAKFLGFETKADWEHVKKYNYESKTVKIPYGIRPSIQNYDKENIKYIFKNKYNINTRYIILSCGGFWYHKGMLELASVFNKINRNDITLVLTGYNNDNNYKPQETENIRTFVFEDKNEVVNAMISSDLYVMNSFSEGFGLVLLESLFYKLPWIARNIAGAIELNKYGTVYETTEELYNLIENIENTINLKNLNTGYEYILNERFIENTVNCIEKCIRS